MRNRQAARRSRSWALPKLPAFAPHTRAVHWHRSPHHIAIKSNQRSGVCAEGDLARLADCFDAPMHTSICRERGGALEHRSICTPISVPANANLFKHSPGPLSSLPPGHRSSSDNPKTADNLSALAGSV